MPRHTDIYPALYAFRFFSLLAHGLFTCMLYNSAPAMVAISLASVSEADHSASRERALVALISASICCLVVDGTFMLTGVSLRIPQLTLANAIAHALGAFFTLWAILDGWTWRSIAYIFLLFTAPPMAAEVLVVRPFGPTMNALAACGRSVTAFFRRCRRS